MAFAQKMKCPKSLDLSLNTNTQNAVCNKAITVHVSQPFYDPVLKFLSIENIAQSEDYSLVVDIFFQIAEIRLTLLNTLKLPERKRVNECLTKSVLSGDPSLTIGRQVSSHTTAKNLNNRPK